MTNDGAGPIIGDSGKEPRDFPCFRWERKLLCRLREIIGMPGDYLYLFDPDALEGRLVGKPEQVGNAEDKARNVRRGLE